jgi:nucleoside-diphosphate-sugar epimerase
MRVGVTGSAGFTGGYLADALAEAGHEAVPMCADLTDPAAINDDAVVHLAGNAFVAADDVDAFYAVNQLGSFHLLDALARHRPGSRILLASSAQVYGDAASGRVDEAYPTRPANHYALSKLAMEMGVGFWADRLVPIIARPFNYTGLGQQDRYLIPKIVRHFRERRAVIELGNIDVERDFGDVRAVARAYAGLIGQEDATGVVNVATGNPYSVRDVIAIAERLTGHSIDVVVNPAFVRMNDVPRLVGDNCRLRTLLPHWEPVDLVATLAWMLAA